MEGRIGFSRPGKGFFLCALMAVCTFLMACLALHDMQSAEGVGLYIAITLQREDRLIFDLLVDVLGAVALLLCVVLPCLGRAGKRRNLVLLMVAYVALMPTVSLDSLIHLLGSPENYRICASVEELLAGIGQVASVAGFWIPVLCLLLAAGRLLDKNRGLSIRQRVFLMVQPVLAILALLFPGFAPHLSFVMQYLLLLSAFEAWESLHENAGNYSLWEVVLFLGLWLRGGYVLFELMSRY